MYQVRWVRSHPERRLTWLAEWTVDDVLNSMADSLATLAIQEYVGKGNTNLIPARDSKRVWYAYTQAIGGEKMRITGNLRQMLKTHIKQRHYYSYLEKTKASHIQGQNLHNVIDQSLLRKMCKPPDTCSTITHMVRMLKTLAGILATETVLTRRNHGTSTNGNDAAICKLCEKAEETNMHMLCECTGNTDLVMERRLWIQRMRKIIKDTLQKKMNPALYEVLLGLWNVDELGKINEWVTDARLNLEAAENDPKLFQLRVLIDKQNGVKNHMYGITTTEWRKFFEDCLEITPATALAFQADLHKCTQHAIEKMWRARNIAKHGMTTPHELWELKTFEAAIKSWKADAERKGKVLVEGSEAAIRAWSRKQKLKWVQNRLKNQKSITEYLTTIPALHIEEGLGLRLGGELELGRVRPPPPDLPLKAQTRVARCLERKQNQQSQMQQSQIQTYFKPKDKVVTVNPTTGKRGSANKRDFESEAHNQQPSKKQVLGEIGGYDTDELNRQIAVDHNQIEEGRQSRSLAIQLQVQMPVTLHETSILKCKGFNTLQGSQTNSKKNRAEESQSTEISEISVNVRAMIAEKKREALKKLEFSLQKRKATEMAIEREKKRKQPTEIHSPELKQQRMSEETNVQAHESLSKRQKTDGQSGCEQLACSTHKGIS
jgi:hypothetical protein